MDRRQLRYLALVEIQMNTPILREPLSLEDAEKLLTEMERKILERRRDGQHGN